MSPLLTGLYIANLDSCVAGGVGAFKYHVFNALDRCEAAALAYAQIYLSVGKLLQKLYGFVKLVDAGLSMLSKSGSERSRVETGDEYVAGSRSGSRTML